jgi:hypothetical protein
VAFELCAHRRRSIANTGGFGAESRVADHLFYIAQPVGPVAEALAGDRAFVAPRARLAVKPLRQVGLRVSTTARVALSSTAAAAKATTLLAARLATLLLTRLLLVA